MQKKAFWVVLGGDAISVRAYDMLSAPTGLRGGMKLVWRRLVARLGDVNICFL